MAADPGLTGPGLATLGSCLVSLIVILALLAAAAYAAKRLRGYTAPRGGAAAGIKILASRQLGWQCALIIVEAEGQLFLIGAGRTGLTAIGKLNHPPASQPAGAGL